MSAIQPYYRILPLDLKNPSSWLAGVMAPCPRRSPIGRERPTLGALIYRRPELLPKWNTWRFSFLTTSTLLYTHPLHSPPSPSPSTGALTSCSTRWPAVESWSSRSRPCPGLWQPQERCIILSGLVVLPRALLRASLTHWILVRLLFWLQLAIEVCDKDWDWLLICYSEGNPFKSLARLAVFPLRR